VPTLLLLHGGPGFDHSGLEPVFTEMAVAAQVVYSIRAARDAAPPDRRINGGREDIHSF
jgi:predicted esterase